MAKKGVRKTKNNAVIGQSGGPTAVINESLVGAVLEARKHNDRIGAFYGACHGVKGILDREFISLSKEPERNLESVAAMPSAALGSVRMKPNENNCRDIFEVFQDLGVLYFFYIGGNDSAETADILRRMAKKADYPLRVFHIPKTIDNDLRVTDHCPGYGSAARFVAQAFMGDNLDNRSIPGIKINIVMGRDAGWLTAASVLGRNHPNSGPHLVYVPERTFDETRFVADVEAVVAKHGRCLIAASEGIRDKNGEPIGNKLIGGVDAFGNKQLSGSGALGDHLANLLRGRIKEKVRVRADTLGYLQRSFFGVRSEVDAKEAREVGRHAVKAAVQGKESGSISIIRESGPRYKVRYERTDLDKVARVTKDLPTSFVNRAGNGITKKFEDYALPLVGKLTRVAYLKGEPTRL